MIGTRQIDDNVRLAIIAAALIAIAAAGAIAANQLSLGLAVAVVAVIIIFTFSFISTEAALYILIIAMLLGPQFATESGEVSNFRGRGFTLRFDDFLIMIIGISWFLNKAISKEIGLILKTPLNLPIALYLVACILGTLNGIYQLNRVKPMIGFFFILKYFEYFLIYFMAVNHLKSREQIVRFLTILLVVCFLVCLYGIYQIPSGVRVSAPFEGEDGEPNTLGGYLVLMLAVAGALASTPGAIKRKAPMVILIGVILIALAATQSRGSWVALPFMLLTLICFSKHRLAIIIPMLIIIAVSPLVMPKSVVDRAAFTFTQPEEEGQLKIGGAKIDTSTSARLMSWQLILTQDFTKHPILGWGITGYSFVDAQYPRVLVETGLTGMVVFLFLIATLFRSALRGRRETKDPLFEALYVGYLAGLVGLLVHGVGANTFIIVRIMEPFWFLTAMVVVAPGIEKQMELISRPAKQGSRT
jgi:O-antigen ligase